MKVSCLKWSMYSNTVISSNVFPLISGGKVPLNRHRPLPRFDATFPPDIKGKTLRTYTGFDFWESGTSQSQT